MGSVLAAPAAGHARTARRRAPVAPRATVASGAPRCVSSDGASRGVARDTASGALAPGAVAPAGLAPAEVSIAKGQPGGRCELTTTAGARTSNGVLVLGMHRSGTSATTRAINLLGVPFCKEDDLWLELPGNPTGYWESSSLTRCNEALLHDLGSAWWCPPRPGEVAALLDDPHRTRVALDLFRTLHSTESWVWKDPRVCATLPFWRAILDARLSCVLVLRHPLEIADSLRARDGMPRGWALALWERYLHLALGALQGLPVCVVEYAQLVDRPAEWADAVGSFLGDRGFEIGDAPDSLEAFVRSELRHSAYGGDDLRLCPESWPEQHELARITSGLVGMWDSFSAVELPDESPATGRLLEALRTALPLDRFPDPWEVERALAFPPTTSEDSMSALAADTDRTTGGLAHDWREWVADNLLMRVSHEQIVEAMTGAGVSASAARAEIESVLADPCWRAGNRAAQQLGKLQSILDMHEELNGLDGRAFALDRVRGLSRRDFLERYYARNRPVVMLGLTDGWPAQEVWRPERLKERLGDVEVEVQSGRESDDHYERNSPEHKSRMTFGEYIDRVSAAGQGNDLYLTANNHFFERAETAPLLEDFTIPDEYVDAESPPGTVFFWFGPAGTVTPLHHDVANVLFVQMLGRKRISLLPALQTHRLYNSVGVFSDVDLLQPDPERHPRFSAATRLDVVVEPGEALFIPVGWWHHVEALDMSISLSFTSFPFPNNYAWQHPQLGG